MRICAVYRVLLATQKTEIRIFITVTLELRRIGWPQELEA